MIKHFGGKGEVPFHSMDKCQWSMRTVREEQFWKDCEHALIPTTKRWMKEQMPFLSQHFIFIMSYNKSIWSSEKKLLFSSLDCLDKNQVICQLNWTGKGAAMAAPLCFGQYKIFHHSSWALELLDNHYHHVHVSKSFCYLWTQILIWIMYASRVDVIYMDCWRMQLELDKRDD